MSHVVETIAVLVQTLSVENKATIHLVTKCQPLLKMSYFQVIANMLTTSADDHYLAGACAMIKVLGHQYRWLALWL